MKKTILKRGDKPYLIRWTLFKCKYFSIKLHKTLMSDTADLHDHPWSYISIILWGGYFEERSICSKSNWAKSGFIKWIERKWYRPGSILFRKAHIPHRLVIPEGKYSITLIFTSAKRRDWGFNVDDKWVSNKEISY